MTGATKTALIKAMKANTCPRSYALPNDGQTDRSSNGYDMQTHRRTFKEYSQCGLKYSVHKRTNNEWHEHHSIPTRVMVPIIESHSTSPTWSPLTSLMISCLSRDWQIWTRDNLSHGRRQFENHNESNFSSSFFFSLLGSGPEGDEVL